MKYYANVEMLESLIKGHKNATEFAKFVGISKQTIYNLLGNKPVNELITKRIAEKININIKELFTVDDYIPLTNKDINAVQLSDEIIMGLIRKIETKLLQSHSKLYVNDIKNVINDIIIEASYFGMIMDKLGKGNSISSALYNRRK